MAKRRFEQVVEAYFQIQLLPVTFFGFARK